MLRLARTGLFHKPAAGGATYSGTFTAGRHLRFGFQEHLGFWDGVYDSETGLGHFGQLGSISGNDGSFGGTFRAIYTVSGRLRFALDNNGPDGSFWAGKTFKINSTTIAPSFRFTSGSRVEFEENPTPIALADGVTYTWEVTT